MEAYKRVVFFEQLRQLKVDLRRVIITKEAIESRREAVKLITKDQLAMK